MSIWHNTNSLYSKLLQVEHDFPKQAVMHPQGAGVGILEVLDGEPIIHSVVRDICRLDIVWQVFVDENYFIIVVDRPEYWDRVMGEIQHIVARHL